MAATKHGFELDGNEQHRSGRSVPMQVLSLGYSRTGTMTIKTALEVLGIPTYHWNTMVEQPNDMAEWERALKWKFERGEERESSSSSTSFLRADWDHLLGGVGAVTDFPAAVFVEELVHAYPEAKVVLVERDVDAWYRSYCDTVIAGAANPFVPLLRIADPAFLGMLGRLTDMVTKHYFRVTNPKDFEAWRGNAKTTYLRHNEMVKAITPTERLLIFRLQDGWGPLCGFIGKDVPPVPFPKTNESHEVPEKARLILQRSLRRAILRCMGILVPVVGVTVAALWIVRSKKGWTYASFFPSLIGLVGHNPR